MRTGIQIFREHKPQRVVTKSRAQPRDFSQHHCYLGAVGWDNLSPVPKHGFRDRRLPPSGSPHRPVSQRVHGPTHGKHAQQGHPSPRVRLVIWLPSLRSCPCLRAVRCGGTAGCVPRPAGCVAVVATGSAVAAFMPGKGIGE